MYTLVIIDDEESILQQLVELFNWNELGFDLVNSFSNIQQFIEYSNQHSFDVLLSDIRLGNYSGLELSKNCKEKNPELEVILISAYSEFDFAKEAIRLKVFEYLLKPITYKAVTDCFLSLKKLLDQRKSEQQDLASNEQKLLLADRRQATFDFMSGISTDINDLEYALQKSGLTIDLKHKFYYQVLGTLSPDATSKTETNIITKYGREAFCFAIDNFCGGLCDQNTSNSLFLLPGYLTSQKMIALLIVDPAACSDSDMHLFFQKLTQNLKELLNITMDFTLSKRTDHLDDSCLRIKNRSIIYQTIPELAHQIRARLSENNKQSALLLLRWGFEDYAADLPSALHFTRELLVPLTNGLDFMAEKQTALIASIQSASTLDRIYSCMQEYLTSLLLFCQSNENNLYQIELAKQYIDKNYMTDIYLNDVADYVSLNPVYFSRFFKKHTGERFIDYLCKIRIEYAILLLKDPQNKAYEICNLVGYQSKKHFYKLFRQYTGYTPIEYRNQLISPSQQILEVQEEVEPI